MTKTTSKCEACCHTCANSLYIGEGDYYCDQVDEIVLTDFAEPTEHYLACKGNKYEADDEEE